MGRKETRTDCVFMSDQFRSDLIMSIWGREKYGDAELHHVQTSWPFW